MLARIVWLLALCFVGATVLAGTSFGAGVRQGLIRVGILAATCALPRLPALGLQLHQRLAETGDVAVAKDAEAALDQPLPDPVTLGELAREELHDRLGDGQLSPLRHWRPPKGSRGSTFCAFQVSRTQV